MTLDIFRLNWILIDTIIIILLLLALISVKIFKKKYRYRFSLSNEALECINSEKSIIKFKNLNIFVKDWSLIKNKIISDKISEKPLIIIIRTNNKKKLIHILSEGLGSYGFDVVNLYLEIKPYTHYDFLENSVKEETKNVLSKTINFYKQNKLIYNSDYFLINYSKSNLCYNSILSDIHNKGLILINPTLNKVCISNLHNILNNTDLKSDVYTIFSKKSNFNIINNNYKKFLQEFNESTNTHLKIISLEKAKDSFKYYETILLGIIIKIIENNSLKS